MKRAVAKGAAAKFDPQSFLAGLSARPGVYRMRDASGEVLYVGKARNLKRRLGSYFSRSTSSIKTHRLVNQIQGIDVTLTHTEGEALLLENDLIKTLRPRYNVLLRDDKSYPYIYLSAHQEFPRLGFYRGARNDPGRYFGPYPSAGAARESLALLQKVFPVRQCEDTFFRSRSRPCLQYQIKRCTAPCVGLVDREAYQQDVQLAAMFLEGRNHAVIDELVKRMDEAAENLDYERAARYRDQIASLRRIQEKQSVSGREGDIDLIVGDVRRGVGCVQVFFIRGGRNLGNKTFFPRQPDETAVADMLEAFVPQYYLGKEIPAEILINHPLEGGELLERVLAEQAGHRVRIARPIRGLRRRWLALAETNLDNELEQRLSSRASLRQRFEALQESLGLDTVPLRVECFDISHTLGEATVASCVVFTVDGPQKSDYRRFNIKGITPGDDYGAMRQALTRRYTRLKQGEGKLPDLLLIDGGKGQLREAERALEELQVSGVSIVGVAKGPGRRPGLETLHVSGAGKTPTRLPPNSPASHLVQQIRDEAHRFAIAGHRRQRGKARTESPLEGIPGIGPKRRRELLQQFGGLQEVVRAGVDDLASIGGISRALAQRIYNALHSH